MIYKGEERKKLDAILRTFEEYIDQQSYFDIVCSKKIGNEIINDVVNAEENKTHIPNALTLSEWEENEVRRGIAVLLEPLAYKI